MVMRKTFKTQPKKENSSPNMQLAFLLFLLPKIKIRVLKDFVNRKIKAILKQVIS